MEAHMLSRPIRWRSLVAIALVIYAVAWFVPVVSMPPLFPISRGAHAASSFGWDAVLTAFSPVLHPGRPESFADALGQIASVASGLTNLVLLAVASSLLVRRGRAAGKRTEAIVWECALLNLVWITMGTDLRLGYVLWIASFVVLAIAIHASRRAATADDAAPLAGIA
jgi:hypothetical protein